MNKKLQLCKNKTACPAGYPSKEGCKPLKLAALCGNPNVGKSTLFNKLTGMKQHTGNWPGKTVSSASGLFSTNHFLWEITDLPGTYSLLPHSAEEEVTRDFLLSHKADVVILVCDATCLEHNLLLALQVRTCCPRMLLCVNLMDEAKKKQIQINLPLLEELLSIPVIGISARQGRGLKELYRRLEELASKPSCPSQKAILSSPDSSLFTESSLEALAQTASSLYARTVSLKNSDSRRQDRRLDKILTGRCTGTFFMLLFLSLILWLTAAGANYPSALLSRFLFSLGNRLSAGYSALGLPALLGELLFDGMYRVSAWIISVMLPPMAIFFPLFTLLEDMGYLPRIAYNLDHCFEKCRACGKQALTMAMGFGCNCVGVSGCRIIDSPRERLIAILTNSFVPCNGRFPTLLVILSLYLAGTSGSPLSSLTAALALTGLIILSILLSLGASWLLSATILKGLPSSFVLELPPYRRPQVGKVILRSVLDRTLLVLGRAVAVAVPAGVLIWCFANLHIGSVSLLSLLSGALDPAGRLLGLDGTILLAFLLGMPANEIVMPILLMAYLEQGSLTEITDPGMLRTILDQNGWTLQTALCTCLFSLFHWPCTTTLLTIKKETGSLKWTAAAFFLPLLFGALLCMTVSGLFTLASLAAS